MYPATSKLLYPQHRSLSKMIVELSNGSGFGVVACLRPAPTDAVA